MLLVLKIYDIKTDIDIFVLIFLHIFIKTKLIRIYIAVISKN